MATALLAAILTPTAFVGPPLLISRSNPLLSGHPIPSVPLVRCAPLASPNRGALHHSRAVPPVAKVGAPPALTSAASTLTSLGGIVAVDTLLRRWFIAKAIPFPSSLAGMLGLFGTLCTLQATRPKLAGAIASAAAPGCAFISRWLALFFVPNLILLPIVLTMSAAEAARLLLLIVLGVASSLPLAALVATAALGGGASVATAPTAAAPPPAAAPPAPRAYLLDPPPAALAALVATSGVAAVLGGGEPALANGFLGVCTVSGFVAGGLLPKKTQKVLHPLISCAVLTQACAFILATLTARPVRSVLRAYLVPGGAALAAPGNMLLAMLGPATLSFAFQMFGRRALMVQSARAVSAVTAFAASFGLFATALAGRLLNLGMPVRLAALPRQVTAPLAIAIAGMLKADPSLAATIVVVTGLLAANFGRAVLDAVGVQSPVARGLAMGAAGHGLGTAAMAEEKEAFPFAAIAMALNAALSTVLVSVPVVRRALLAAAGA